MAVQVTSANFEAEVVNSDKPVLVDFWASWCGPCKMLLPIVEQVSEEVTDFKVVKINTDDNQDLAMKFGIRTIPTLLVFKNGVEVKRSVGVIPKEEILSLVRNA